MEEFFQLYPSRTSISWFEDPPMVNIQSDFHAYTEKPFKGLSHNHRNFNKRMIEFLKKTHLPPAGEIERYRVKDRSHKHKISERMRREKLNQNYLAIHKFLPLGTKSDKKSILEMAVKEIEEMKKCKEVLEGQNREMGIILGATEKAREEVEKAEIKLRVAYPASGVDSMFEVLKCLKETGSNATSIVSNFSDHEFSAALVVETKIRAADVEKAVQRTLFEAEIKFRQQVKDKNGSCLTILESGPL
ncbi:hypothetical protein ACP275_07G041700 [Erythranthe tilingii]